METKGISKLDLKRRNRRQILLAIRRDGMLARVDIAAQLALTRAAVTIITNQMIAQNILEDMSGPLPVKTDEPPRKGRKKTMIRINPTFRYVLGAVVEERGVSVGLSDLSGKPLGHEILMLSEDSGMEQITAFIVKSVKKLMKKASLTAKQVLGLGLGIVPAHWKLLEAEEAANHQVFFPKLIAALEKDLHLPVCAANAIGLYAMANIEYGKEEQDNLLLLYKGESYHFAAVTDSTLVGGIFANTALVDRLIITPNGEKAEGYPDGSVHAEMTDTALNRRIKAAIGRELTLDEINEAFIAKDPKLLQILEEVLDKIAVLIHNLCIGHRTTRVILQHFHPCDEAKDYVQKKLDSICETPGRIRIVYSPIDKEQAYLAGCALAAEKLFFDLGGLQPGDPVA
ncbi:MAG: ROK family protein [Oscillospiraceae bacterium]|nr:ROK family protein [Oscillospiraceae bacterium]